MPRSLCFGGVELALGPIAVDLAAGVAGIGALWTCDHKGRAVRAWVGLEGPGAPHPPAPDQVGRGRANSDGG